jgi:hypothetical protein
MSAHVCAELMRTWTRVIVPFVPGCSTALDKSKTQHGKKCTQKTLIQNSDHLIFQELWFSKSSTRTWILLDVFVCIFTSYKKPPSNTTTTLEETHALPCIAWSVAILLYFGDTVLCNLFVRYVDESLYYDLSSLRVLHTKPVFAFLRVIVSRTLSIYRRTCTRCSVPYCHQYCAYPKTLNCILYTHDTTHNV